MSAFYWSKLPHSFFDDRRIDSLEPELYKIFIKLFLLAGIENGADKTGALPEFADIVYRLRYWNDEQLETAMVELEGKGLLSRNKGKWLVTDYGDIQAPEPAKERKRQERIRKAQTLGTVTKRDTEENRIEKNRKEEEEEVDTATTTNSFDDLWQVFKNETGVIPDTREENNSRQIYKEKWEPSGVTQDEVIQAIRELRGKGFKIIGFGSLTSAINIIRASANRQPDFSAYKVIQ